MKTLHVFIGPIFVVFCLFSVEAKNIPEGYYHSDAIVTRWPEKSSPVNVPPRNITREHNEPGWVKRQLLKFGQMASKIGNAMGAHSNKITQALDKICEVVKTVIPLLAAVCHVGKFGFCSATDDAPLRLSEAMNPNDLNLDSLDR